MAHRRHRGEVYRERFVGSRGLVGKGGSCFAGLDENPPSGFGLAGVLCGLGEADGHAAPGLRMLPPERVADGRVGVLAGERGPETAHTRPIASSIEVLATPDLGSHPRETG